MGPVRAPSTRVGRTHERPARTHHDVGSHRGGVRAPTEACAPLMMGHALDPGPATTPSWLLARVLGGSLGAHPHLLPFFSTQTEFLNSIFRNDINSRRSARCCGTQDAEKEGQEAEEEKNRQTWKEEAPHPPRRDQEGL
jgi:hypothetical protein